MSVGWLVLSVAVLTVVVAAVMARRRGVSQDVVANAVRLFVNGSLLLVAWQHTHWSVALLLTLHSLHAAISDHLALKVAAVLKATTGDTL